MIPWWRAGVFAASAIFFIYFFQASVACGQVWGQDPILYFNPSSRSAASFLSLGGGRLLLPTVSIMCSPARFLQSAPSIPCSLLGVRLSPGCCFALPIYSFDEWGRQEADTFVTKPHMGFQLVMTLP